MIHQNQCQSKCRSNIGTQKQAALATLGSPALASKSEGQNFKNNYKSLVPQQSAGHHSLADNYTPPAPTPPSTRSRTSPARVTHRPTSRFPTAPVLVDPKSSTKASLRYIAHRTTRFLFKQLDPFPFKRLDPFPFKRLAWDLLGSFSDEDGEQLEGSDQAKIAAALADCGAKTAPIIPFYL
ncbi:hypothetical protein PGT21_026213 [Puccinia graminis f. sp. tritici]|uniref:Uncharacterized protein n=1 Tax=Puccinia graminis f. sp. tritici TaxID=56615 RepID=A0A5B0QJU4_PUCGR|nr:hypothetical protein PGT21_026213 [Puccinia graminis f. sp. tritici]